LSGVSSTLTFQVRTPFCLVLVSEAAGAQIRRYRQVRRRDPEAGGVLLGIRRGPHFEIVEVTAPQTMDGRSRYSFLRTGKVHRRLGLVGYLGEWHTHPEKSPAPSWTDRFGWNRLFAQTRQPLVHLILGTERLGCWYCDEAGRLHEAKCIPACA